MTPACTPAQEVTFTAVCACCGVLTVWHAYRNVDGTPFYAYDCPREDEVAA